MNDLEQRLRDDLSALADAVPASTGGWAEHRRRVMDRNRQTWRGPALAAAVTTVLAGAAVGGPLLLRGEPATPGTGTGIPVSPTVPVPPMPSRLQVSPQVSPIPTSPGPPPSPAATRPPGPSGQAVLVTPTELGRFTENGVDWIASAYTERRGDGVEWLCVVGTPADGSGREHPNSLCSMPFAWPDGQPVPLVHTRPVLPEPRLIDSGPLAGLVVFVARPEVAGLVVRDGPGADVPVRELAGTATLTLYLADFGGSSQGFGYTAYDSAGNVLESAIT